MVIEKVRIAGTKKKAKLNKSSIIPQFGISI